jgi:hypothetical protein
MEEIKEGSREERQVEDFKVNGDLLQGILNYLAQRPYIEVEGMIQALLEITKKE